MPTEQKERVIEQAKEWYGKSVGLVFADYRGLKVKELQQLRRNLGAKGGEIHVIKNTLARRVIATVTGPSAVGGASSVGAVMACSIVRDRAGCSGTSAGW